MKRNFRRVPFRGLCAIVLGLLCFAPEARADLSLDIRQGNPQPMPIALPNFLGQGNDGQVGAQVTQVVSADLERSGLFKPLDPRSFIQDPAALSGTPRFADWKLINAQALVTGAVTAQPDGHLRIDFRLWDVLGGQQMTGFSYNTPVQNWRSVSHIIADAIYKRITGEDGYFNTRVVYIAESGPALRRIKRLAIMDQDGFNNKVLTDGRSLVLTPRFSPSSQEITYLSYARGVPQVFMFNIDTGQQEVLGQFPGMTFAPRFSPDGNKVIFALSNGANSQIFTQDLRTRKVTQITSSNAIDSGPSYSPDGSQITFESDRGGGQQVYVMNADGSNQHRISFGAGRNSTPVWSPRGDLIAFTKQEGGNFSIGVMQPDGQHERILTNGFLVEGPTWAPNGRVLMYFKETPSNASGSGGTTRLYSIDLTGSNEREVVTPTDGSDPAWSPLLQ